MLLARRQLLAYGLPGLPLALLGLPLYVYLPSFYVQELGLSLALVGTLLLLARGVDVITDPLIGALNDRWPDGRWRRRAAMLIGAPLLLVGTEFLFRPLAGAGGAYLLGWTLLAYLGWTLISVAYNAWGAELSPHYHERTRIAASREGFMIAGTVLAVSLPVLTGSADDTGAALSQFATLLWVLVPLTLLVAVTSLGEDATAPPAVPRRAPSTDALTRARWAALLQLPGLRRLLLAYLLNGIANGLPATLFLLFVAYVLQAEAQTGPLLATYFLSGILALPLWLALSRRLDKHRAWAASMLLASAVFLCVPFLGAGDVTAFFIVCLLSGLSLGADLALPASLQADLARRCQETNGRSEAGLLFGVWGMITKLALALAVGIAFPLLDAVGFVADEGNTQGLLTLALLYGALPVLFKLAAVALVWQLPTQASQSNHATQESQDAPAPHPDPDDPHHLRGTVTQRV